MTSREIILTMGNRENFMCNWFEFLPTELKKEIMMRIPGWKRSCNLGDVILFKGVHGYHEKGIQGCIIDYIFNTKKKYYEYCFQIIDDNYLKIYPEKSLFWRDDYNFVKTNEKMSLEQAYNIKKLMYFYSIKHKKLGFR